MLKALLLLTATALLGQAPLRVPWLPAPPSWASLPAMDLKAEDGGAGRVTLRWGADADALYVRVTSDQATLACRDRAYQNGDGLILVLATLEPGRAPTKRFRVMGFSPQPEAQRNWQHAFTWYRDVELRMEPLAGARFAWGQGKDGLSFELRVPWTALAPYHPLLTPSLGMNACFVRAEGTATRSFSLKEDRFLQSEQHPRVYVPVQFEPPPALAAPAWFARPARGTLEAGAPLRLAVGASGPVEVNVRVLEGEGGALGRAWTVSLQPGTRELPLEGLILPAGGHQVELQGPGRTLAWGVTVLPEGGAGALRERLQRLGPALAPGTRSTLAFRLRDAETRLAGLAPTDPAPAVRRLLAQAQQELLALEGGRDPVAAQRGVLRRAYLSTLDQTLQPYTVRVPERLDPGALHPLLVYLHGSGQDDQKVLEARRAPEGWFELAPSGRGTSNCFSADHAQDDLREAIADVLANYPVDPDRIILAGFSMGGYGGYRTVFERPGFFRGLAVFSGAPDMATRWLGAGHPDFLDPAALAPFKGLPVFIFHGTEDRNCPFGKTERLVGLLKSAGADVTFVVEAGKGHEAPGPANLAASFGWLGRWSDPVPGHAS